MLPVGLKNNRKTCFALDPPEARLPPALPPFSTEQETIVVKSLISEINGTFGLGLDGEVSLSRDTDPVLATGTGRLILVGASHVKRIAKELINTGSQVVDLSVPGWVPGPTSVAAIKEKLSAAKPGKQDTVLVDLLSNSAFMGTDDQGLPTRPVRHSDGH